MLDESVSGVYSCNHFDPNILNIFIHWYLLTEALIVVVQTG